MRRAELRGSMNFKQLNNMNNTKIQIQFSTTHKDTILSVPLDEYVRNKDREGFWTEIGSIAQGFGAPLTCKDDQLIIEGVVAQAESSEALMLKWDTTMNFNQIMKARNDFDGEVLVSFTKD